MRGIVSNQKPVQYTTLSYGYLRPNSRKLRKPSVRRKRSCRSIGSTRLELRASMNAFCGDFKTRGVQCVSNASASSVLLASALLLIIIQFFGGILPKEKISGLSRRWKRLDWLLVGSFGLLAATHLASVIVLAVLGTAPAHYYSEAAFFAAWCLAMAVGWTRGVGKMWKLLRLFVWEATFLYGFTLFMHAWFASSAKVAIYTLVMTVVQFGVAVVASVLTLVRRETEAEDGLEQLLPPEGRDVEAGVEKRDRSWYSLIGTALKHVWPHSLGMQIRVLICLLIVAAQRLVNLAVPILYRDVINRASEITNALKPTASGAVTASFTFMQAFYPFVLAYIVVAYVQGSLGSAGMLRSIRAWLWEPVSQDAYKRISMLLFDHLMNLDLQFHLMRKTGEISKICDRGTDAMQEILSMVLFGSLPQLFDITVSCAYMAAALQPWIALIVFVLLITYIPLSIYMTEQKGKIRKEMNQYENNMGSTLTEALLNYETVKNFCNENVESEKLGTAIGNYQKAEYNMVISFNVINLIQGTIVFCATGLGLVLCLKEIAEGKLTVGDLVLFLALMSQLYGPLNYFASLYRRVQKNMMNMDQMLSILEIEPCVKDSPGAKHFKLGDCSLQFDNVCFGYSPLSPVLKNVSFKLEGGKTLALVGSTGSGKSTALRLIFRYFDPSSGSIRVDGQDLKTVTQKSFREHVAVVPQDTVLFNSSIRENIRYGRPGCSDEEVETAADASAIHDPIVNRFPKAYDTVVGAPSNFYGSGERGLRLSGGEKQRVAFARALLKNPNLLLLDEATSSLDTLTERKIQGSLAESRDQRTTVIVAHRLSTIMDADLIVCFKEGEVVEQGNHSELLAAQGLYYRMWSQQEFGAKTLETLDESPTDAAKAKLVA